MRRLTRRRAADPPGSEPTSGPAAETPGASSTSPTETGGGRSLLVDPAADRTATAPAVEAHGAGATAEHEKPSDVPAGIDPAELERAPEPSSRRSRLRRRVRFLRAARDVLLRDLGGFVLEVHRTAQGEETDAHRRLRDVKLARLMRLDAELRELQARLEQPSAETVVHVPGVGGECPECGELHASDARFCAHCGTPLSERERRARERAAREAAAAAAAAAAGEAQPAASEAQPAAGEPGAAGGRPAAGAQPTAGEPGAAGARPDAPSPDDQAATQVLRPHDEPSYAAPAERRS